ncbi:MAG: 1-acyl-sn-glycerol-3-phosphate acyltransferase [Bacillota bacterium]
MAEKTEKKKKVNKKWTSKRHSFFFAIFRPIGRLYCRTVFHFKGKMNKLDKKKSYVVLSNHLTFADQFILGSFFNRAFHFISSDDLMNKWTGKYLLWMLGCIPKAKSSKDLSTIRNAKKVINEGGSVMVFPEGNRTYSGELCHVDIAIAKFCKVLKSDVIIYNLIGGFGVEPRFAHKVRKGVMNGEIREIIPAEDVAEMSVEDLYQRIIAGLTVPTVKDQLFKSDIKAEYAERSVYICPECGSIDRTWSKGNYIYCKDCDLKVEYLENMDIAVRNGNAKFTRLADWYNWQKAKAIELFGNENDITLANKNLQLFQVENMRLSVIGNFDIEFNCTDGLKAFENGNLYLHVPFDDILNMGLMARTKVIIYTKHTIYHLKENDIPTNMMKFMHMFYIHKQRKAGVEGNDNLFLGL